MNRRFFLLLILLAVVLSIGVISVFYQNFLATEEPPPSDPLEEVLPKIPNISKNSSEKILPSDAIFHTIDDEITQNIPENKTFLIKEINGRVIVYGNGGEEFLYSVDEIDLFALPQSDREALKEGIFLPSEEALAKLLEDYSS